MFGLEDPFGFDLVRRLVLRRRALAAEAARKKLATVGTCKPVAEAQLQQFFEKTQAYQFAAKAAQSHRVFVFSADTYFEGGTLAGPQGKPWCTPVPWGTGADVIMKWMLTNTGPGDVLMVCDGRSKACRKKLEEFMDKARHVSEVWVIYKPSPRLGRSVFLASDNRETIWISMPANKTLIACKPRSGECNSAGESTTHDSTYSGVSPMPWLSMPLVSAVDKEKIHGVQPATPREKLFDCSMGQPLFWNERKTPAFWGQLMEDVNAKSVVDLSPSGSLGRACLAKGIFYTAVAKNPEHNSWLQNLLDRSAMQIITTQGSSLHEQDLATCVKEHFQDVLDQLHDQDACEDTCPEEGEESATS
jgi:hypothetical protein